MMLAVFLLMLVGDAAMAGTDSEWITVKVARVTVAPKKADGSTWDLRGERNDSGCVLIKAMGRVVASGAGEALAGTLCAHADSGQRDPTAPDVFVKLVVDDTTYRTPIMLDTADAVFDYAFVVPLDAVPRSGLELQVLDADGSQGDELIGMLRVTADQLRESIKTTTQTLTLSDGSLKRLEIVTEPYAPSKQARVQFDVTQSPASAQLKARVGELVTVRAAGRYSVADNRQSIDVIGYADRSRRSYNLQDFPSNNHAVAVAFVGNPTATHAAIAVGQCAAAVSPTAGEVFVGVNDRDTSNNRGNVTFEVSTSLPSLDQWRTGGGSFRCLATAPTASLDEKLA